MDSRRRATRREFLKMALPSMCLSTLAFPGVAGAQGRRAVTYFSYATYTDPRLLGDFTKQTGISLSTQSVGSTDQLVARLKAGRGAGLDVAMASQQYCQELYRDGIFEPIDVRRLKNWKDVYPEFQTGGWLRTGTPDKVIAVPFVWGPEGLIYRTDRVDQVGSWSSLWDKRYKGRIAIPDYAYEMILVAALILGFRDNLLHERIDFSESQYAAIKAKLIEQKALVTKYWGSAAEGASLIVSGEAWVGVGRIAMLEAAHEEKAPVRLVAPKEGAMGWCTSNAILTASKNKEAAYELIDYMVGDTYQQRLSTIKGYPMANRRLMMALPQEKRNILTLNDPNLLSSMLFWNQAGDPQRMTALWNEVKAA